MNFSPFVIFRDTEKSLDSKAMESEISPVVEEDNEEQTRNRVLDFHSYLTGSSGETTLRNHLLRTMHLDSCAFRTNGPQTPCSCCVGSMTFSTADEFINGMIKEPSLATPAADKVQKTLTDLPEQSMLGLNNFKRMFGCSTSRAAFNATFGIGDSGQGNKHDNILWGTNGLISRTLKYWKDGIVSLFDYIGQLRLAIKRTKKRSKTCKKLWNPARRNESRWRNC